VVADTVHRLPEGVLHRLMLPYPIDDRGVLAFAEIMALPQLARLDKRLRVLVPFSLRHNTQMPHSAFAGQTRTRCIRHGGRLPVHCGARSKRGGAPCSEPALTCSECSGQQSSLQNLNLMISALPCAYAFLRKVSHTVGGTRFPSLPLLCGSFTAQLRNHPTYSKSQAVRHKIALRDAGAGRDHSRG